MDIHQLKLEALMTYLFKSRATGDVLMLKPDGDAVLRIIGREPDIKGIIEPAALPAAIAAIERAIAEEKLLRAGAAQAVERSGDTALAEADVTLGQRTWPALRLLKSAHAAATEVVWGV